MAETPRNVKVRDTGHREPGYRTFPSQEWVALLRSSRYPGV
ncbi:hypothetical protein BQ8420_08295 [Nocardiopsis sp. JB363]|nr:hypothetical protein BQ8420_08295 [Nocardiopsis sp. JB363]